MNAEFLFAALFGAGGSGALAGLWTIVQSVRKGKLDKEETLIKRLNDRSQADLIAREEAERDAAKYRMQRIRAQDQAARFRRMLIMHTDLKESDLDKLEEFDD